MPRAAKSPATPAGPRLVARSSRLPSARPAADDQIRLRAYELFLQDGRVHGHDVEHWLRAERELLAAGPLPATKAVA